jgi:hypothetical protein
MKRTCFQKSTNTDKQIACEFHPVEHFAKRDQIESKEGYLFKNL